MKNDEDFNASVEKNKELLEKLAVGDAAKKFESRVPMIALEDLERRVSALETQSGLVVKAPASGTLLGYELITPAEASRRLFAQRDTLMGLLDIKHRAERVLEALEAIVAQYGTSYGSFFFAGPLWDEAWEAIEQYKNPGAKRTAETSAASQIQQTSPFPSVKDATGVPYEQVVDHGDPWDWQ